MTTRKFDDRRAAGAELGRTVAGLIARHPEIGDPVILALPRGGVPVAFEVARAIGAPLDLVIARKIGVPRRRELAAAAVVDGDPPIMVVNETVVARAKLTDEDLAAGKERQIAEIERRRRRYLGDRACVPVTGRDAIVVDDGIATGATVRAVLKALRRRRPRSLSLAVPVAAPGPAEALRAEVDHMICLDLPERFRAVGHAYRRFAQVGDREVVRLLREAPGAEFGPEQADRGSGAS